MKTNYSTIDEYIAAHDEVAPLLHELRAAILTAVPNARQSISYGMPAFSYCGKPLAYFAAHTAHIGFYPLPSGIAEFKVELAAFRTTKGGVQFPYHQPLPLDLVTRMVKHRAIEIAEKAGVVRQ